MITSSYFTFVIEMIVWIFLQMSRAIAIVLINDIYTGAMSEAWRYPAYLDLFAVFFFDSFSFDPFSVVDDRLSTPEVDVCGREIVCERLGNPT